MKISVPHFEAATVAELELHRADDLHRNPGIRYSMQRQQKPAANTRWLVPDSADTGRDLRGKGGWFTIAAPAMGWETTLLQERSGC